MFSSMLLLIVVCVVTKATATEYLLQTPGCRIPYKEAKSNSVKKFLFKENPPQCEKNPIVYSTDSALIVNYNALKRRKYSDLSDFYCCAEAFERIKPKTNEHDTQIQIKTSCENFTKTMFVKDEYYYVKCFNNKRTIYKDFFSFVPPIVPNQTYTVTSNTSTKYKVLLLGMDAVSRLNFLRQMPKTYNFLKQHLNAVEMLGFNSIAEHRFPNLMPVLTGYTDQELSQLCVASDLRFDQCHFIWDDFREAGYKTAFAEDATWMGLFHSFNGGFYRQPTDYWWRTFSHFAELLGGTDRRYNAYLCIGSTPTYRALLDYVAKFVRALARFPFFGFFWTSSLSHDLVNLPRVSDDDYVKLLRSIEPYLGDTVLILMSDHGIIQSPIVHTSQGRLEKQLPLLYVSVPEMFRQQFPFAYENLLENAHRLTTPFDLHETLLDLVNPSRLERSALLARDDRRRGISLFELIPNTRTCRSAAIPKDWCACQKPKMRKHG